MAAGTSTLLERAAGTCRGVGEYANLVVQTFGWIFRQPPRMRIITDQMFRLGVRSVPVVVTTGVFTGMVLAVQSYQQFSRLQVENIIGALVTVSMVKELGPVLTALMLAGRIGSSMAAELGTMKVTEQVDALRTLGSNPIQYLVVPRFIACVLLAPALTVLADGVGIVGGWLVGVQLLGVDNHYFWYHAADYTDTWDILAGVVKAFVFGGIIATICCYKGLNAGHGAEGVGQATTSANVLTCMVILVSNFFLAIVTTSLYDIFMR